MFFFSFPFLVFFIFYSKCFRCPHESWANVIAIVTKQFVNEMIVVLRAPGPAHAQTKKNNEERAKIHFHNRIEYSKKKKEKRKRQMINNENTEQ